MCNVNGVNFVCVCVWRANTEMPGVSFLFGLSQTKKPHQFIYHHKTVFILTHLGTDDTTVISSVENSVRLSVWRQVTMCFRLHRCEPIFSLRFYGIDVEICYDTYIFGHQHNLAPDEQHSKSIVENSLRTNY